eukprot:6769504-Ditylum_brightwellii.AAC.1
MANIATKADPLERSIHTISKQISPSNTLISQLDEETSLSDSNSTHEGENVLSGGKQAHHDAENGIDSSCLADDTLQETHHKVEVYWACCKCTGVGLKEGINQESLDNKSNQKQELDCNAPCICYGWSTTLLDWKA